MEKWYEIFRFQHKYVNIVKIGEDRQMTWQTLYQDHENQHFFQDFSRFGKFSKFHELEPTSTIFHLFSTNGSMCWARSRADSWTGWLAIFRVVLSWCLYAASRTKRVYMASTTQKVVKIVWKHTLPDNSWLTFNDDLFFV